MSRRFIVVLLALFLAFTWSLAPEIPPANAEEGPLGGLYGGDFVVAVDQNAVFDLDPSGNPDETSRHIIDLLYDSLARIDSETLLPVPWVASSWTVNEANETVLVRLRTDVTWHDGGQVTADDVLYTYQTAYGVDYSVNKISENEILFDLSGTDQDGIFLTMDLSFPLIRSDDTIREEGCGAFALESINSDEVIIKAYEDYFDGRPYLDNITFRKYPGFDEATDPTADAMIRGEIGLLGWPLNTTESSVFLNVSNETITKTVSVLTSPTFKFLYVGINTQRIPLNDSIIRKAIAMSMDKDLYLTMESNTIIADSVIHPSNSFWLNASVPRYRVKSKVEDGAKKSDLDSVKIMLEESGYTDKDSDGFREMPDGSEFYFEFFYPSSSIEVQKSPIATNLIGKLQTIGLDVRDMVMETWDDLYLNVADGNFDIFMGVLDARREPSFIRDILHSSGSENYVKYDNATFDQILKNADDAISMTERQELVKYAQGWIAEENPIIPILHYEIVEAVNKTKFTGWVGMAEGVYNFWSFKNLHLTQEDPPRVSVIILADQIGSGEVIEIEVEVKHPKTFASMPGVFVNVTESLEPDASYAGYTDAQGSFVFNWTVPIVTEPRTAVFTARTSIPGFPESQAVGEITVHPGARLLEISLVRNPPRIASDGTSTVTITVRDSQTLQPVEGAEVSIRLSPEALEGSLSNPSGVTDASGVFQSTLTASVSVDTFFVIIVDVSKAGYSDEVRQTSVFVDRSGGTPPGIPALEAISMMLVVVLLTLGYAYWRGKSRGRGPKRK
ncbi:MAG: ABC transporter substrate-binding protein [Thermoplasmata archaeon]